MLFIAADKVNKTVLEIGENSLDLADLETFQRFRSALSINHAISVSDVHIYYEADKTGKIKDVIDGAEYVLVWTGDSISDIDLTPETSKRIVKARATKNSIKADGSDSTVITIEIWKAAGSAVDSAVNITTLVPVITPDGQRKVSVTFQNGIATRTFKTVKSGIWQIPMEMKRYGAVRIDSVATVEAIEDFSTL